MIVKMVRPELTDLTVTEFAEVLFATGLQESDAPTTAQVRAAVWLNWLACGESCAPFAARLAQEAGDHPEQAARRMRWARGAAERAVGTAHLALAG
jgi:DsbC/DsbD-like thiol-disulfide interchange protein